MQYISKIYLNEMGTAQFCFNICSVLYQERKKKTDQARQVSAGTQWQLTHRRCLIFNATQTL